MSLSKENKVVIDGQTYYGGLNQPPKFVKVNVDCWEKIFDYLSLRNILSMSQTCQRMRQIGGFYFRENFYGSECRLNADSGARFSPPKVLAPSILLERDDFLRFVDTVRIDRDLKHLKHYSSLDVLGSLTTLRLWRVELNANAIGNFEKKLMDNIETVELIDCTIHDDFDGQLFASCPKLKCLKLFNMTSNNLLRYTYPTLTHFGYVHYYAPASLFTSFLERNSSIKTLQINADILLEIGLNTSSVQLDCLAVDTYAMTFGQIDLANRLKTLHANGFYKKLHLSLVRSSDHELFVNEMKSFGALEVLSTRSFNANICHLTELKELRLFRLPHGEAALDSIARNITKLERVWIFGDVDHLIPFLRYTKALKIAVLDDYNNHNPLDLLNLNQMRHVGGSKRKVLIGLHENQYLTTRWKSKNVKYDFVEIARAETIRELFEGQTSWN